jgi:hypothetical protein
MLARVRRPALTAATFTYDKGSAISFLGFLRMFQPAEQKMPYAIE